MIPIVIICLTLVIISGMVASVHLSKITALKPPAPPNMPAHPCAAFHTFEPITTRHIDASTLSCTHTSLLSRCTVCLAHKTELYPGNFQLEDFVAKTNEIERLEGLVR